MDFKKFLKILAAVAVVAIVAVLLGVFGDDVMYHLQDRSAIGPLTREDIEYVTVEIPAATSKDGTVNASDWAETYPYIVATMGDNKENSYITSYLEQDPYLVNISTKVLVLPRITAVQEDTSTLLKM